MAVTMSDDDHEGWPGDPDRELETLRHKKAGPTPNQTATLILGDLQENNDHVAVNVLGAFIHHVEAQYGKKISASDADALIEVAGEIIELLNQPESASRQHVASPRLFPPAGRRHGRPRPQEPE